MSATVHDQVAGKVDARFEDLGRLELKNIERPVRAYRIPAASIEGGDDEPSALARFCAYPTVIAAGSESEDEIDIRRPELPSVMILPFENLGGDEGAPLVRGLQLSVQSVLVRLPGLFLVSPAAPETYRGRSVSAVRAGNEVGTRYVLEGTAQVAGERLRLDVQLTDVLEVRIVWAERYDRVVGDAFAIQDEIANGIVTALHIQLIRSSDALELRWWQEELPTWSAREKVLRGLSHQYRGTKEDNELARGLYTELVEELPESGRGQGLALIALSHWLDAFRGWSVSPEASIARATELAEQAVAISDPDGWAHLVLGHTRLFQRRYDEALALSDISAVRRPSCPLAGAMFAEVLRFTGEPERALGVLKSSVRKARVYPPWMLITLAATYRDIGNVERSIAVAEAALRLDRESPDGLVVLAADYSLARRDGEARRAAEELVRRQPGFSCPPGAPLSPTAIRAPSTRSPARCVGPAFPTERVRHLGEPMWEKLTVPACQRPADPKGARKARILGARHDSSAQATGKRGVSFPPHAPDPATSGKTLNREDL